MELPEGITFNRGLADALAFCLVLSRGMDHEDGTNNRFVEWLMSQEPTKYGTFTFTSDYLDITTKVAIKENRIQLFSMEMDEYGQNEWIPMWKADHVVDNWFHGIVCGYIGGFLQGKEAN